jgi:hypothetical protein
LALKGFDLLTVNKLNPEIKYNNCTIDVIIEIGKLKISDLTKGRIKIFWDRERNYTIGYLPSGARFFDGYEVFNKWVRNITISDCIPLIEKDMDDLFKFP